MKKTSVKITAFRDTSGEAPKQPERKHPYDDDSVLKSLGIFYTFTDVTGLHAASEGMEDAIAYRGKLKPNMAQVTFTGIMNRIKDKGFKPFSFDKKDGLTTSGIVNGIEYIIEIQANFIMIYKMDKEGTK